MSPNDLSEFQDVSPLVALPAETWDSIADHLDKKTLDAATRVSHLFRKLLIRQLFYRLRLKGSQEELSSKLKDVLKTDLACLDILDPRKYVHQLWIQVLPLKEPEPGTEATNVTLLTEPKDFERDLPRQVASLLCCLPNLASLGIALEGFSQEQNREFASIMAEIAPLNIGELFAALPDVAATPILQACPRLRRCDSLSSDRSVHRGPPPIITQQAKSQRNFDGGDETERSTAFFINQTMVFFVLKTFKDLQWLSICESLPYKPDPLHGAEEFRSSIESLTTNLAKNINLRGLCIELRHETAWELMRCDAGLQEEAASERNSSMLDKYYLGVLKEMMESLPYVDQLSAWAKDANLCYKLRRGPADGKAFTVTADRSDGMKLTHGIYPYALFGYPGR